MEPHVGAGTKSSEPQIEPKKDTRKGESGVKEEAKDAECRMRMQNRARDEGKGSVHTVYIQPEYEYSVRIIIII